MSEELNIHDISRPDLDRAVVALEDDANYHRKEPEGEPVAASLNAVAEALGNIHADLYAEIGEDFVAIREDVPEGTREWVYWHADEWKEDPSVISSIANAVRLCYEDPDELKDRLDNQAVLIDPTDGSMTGPEEVA